MMIDRDLSQSILWAHIASYFLFPLDLDIH